MNNRMMEPGQGSWEGPGFGSRRFPPWGGVSSLQSLGIATDIACFSLAGQHLFQEQVKFILSPTLS